LKGLGLFLEALKRENVSFSLRKTTISIKQPFPGKYEKSVPFWEPFRILYLSFSASDFYIDFGMHLSRLWAPFGLPQDPSLDFTLLLGAKMIPKSIPGSINFDPEV